jgi:hypothetical protein
MSSGVRLRIVGADPFVLEWTSSDWSERVRVESLGTRVNVYYVDIPPVDSRQIRFRFQNSDGRHAGHEYAIEIGSR